MNEHKKACYFRALAREQLHGNWGKSVLAYLIFFLIVNTPSVITPFAGILSVILLGPFIFGMTKFCLKITRTEIPTIETIFNGFNIFLKTFLLYILMYIFIFLWSLLLIIPGIIASFNYSMAFFILHDNPELSPREALKKSKDMMYGYKLDLFLLTLSFIGWMLLCIPTFGIGLLWLCPYMQVSLSNFYENLKEPKSKIEINNTLFKENSSLDNY